MTAHVNTRTGFSSKCSCFDCRVNRSVWERKRYAAAKAGRPYTTTGHKAAKRLQEFLDAGFTMKAIGRVISSEGRDLQYIVDDPSRHIHRRTEERVLGIKPSEIEPGRVNGAGATRRLRDLSLLGWRIGIMAARAGLSENTIRNVLLWKNPIIAGTTDKKIRDMYEMLSREEPPNDPAAQSWVRRSQKRGWKRLAAFRNPEFPQRIAGEA